MSVASETAPSLQCWFKFEGIGKKKPAEPPPPSQVSMADASKLSRHYLLNPWTKPTGALEHCREGRTDCWLPGRLLLTSSIRQRWISMYISLLTVAVDENFTDECQRIFWTPWRYQLKKKNFSRASRSVEFLDPPLFVTGEFIIYADFGHRSMPLEWMKRIPTITAFTRTRVSHC